MKRAAIVSAVLLVASIALTAQTKPAATTPAQTKAAPSRVTSPKQAFGFNIGDDYQLANFKQLTAYWKQLASETPRVHLEDIGKTSEGRTMLMAIITDPANWPKINRYKEISRKLATGDVKDDADARALAKEGKSVVWIDGGLHASEVLGAQQLIELTYQLASGTDEETT